jgi:type IV pilus assembly protein PilV
MTIIHPYSPRTRETGFTLIEVLIAVTVLSFGLLGVAGLQVTGMRGVQSSSYRFEAARLAEDLTDRMRANIKGLRAGYYKSTDIKTDVGSLTLCTSSCTTADLAKNDLIRWYAEVQRALQLSATESAAKASVSCSDGACAADSIVGVTIQWRERADLAERNADSPTTVAAADQTTVKSYRLFAAL